MAQDESSELPQHYGTKTASGELVTRPGDDTGAPTVPEPPTTPHTPRRASTPPRRRAHSPEPTERPPLEFEYISDRDRDERAGDGARRRPSALVQTSGGSSSRRRSDAADYDRPYYSSSGESRRPMRWRDDEYYRERDDEYERDRRPYRQNSRRDSDRDVEDYERHHDFESRKPPRSYHNSMRQGRDMVDRRPNKAYYEETKVDYREEPDTPSPKRFRKMKEPDEESSIEGYDYDGQRTHRTTIDLKALSPEQRKEVMRLPWVQWMNSNAKNHFVATVGEFIGTTMFLFFAFAGTQVANIQSQASDATPSTSGSTSGGVTGFNISVYLYIAIIFGFSLMVNVWIFFRISGGLFNPAVTFGMVLVGALPVVRACCLFFAQMAGGIAASAMVRFLFPTQFNVRTTLAGGTSLVQGVFIEAFLTAELVFTIFMLAKEKHKATFIAPVGIGLALFIAEMVGVYYTGGSLNPARSFGPCAVTGTFDKEHWIYWAGPIIGTLIAVFFYKFIKMLEYEMANPGQDGDDKNDPTKNREKAAQVIKHETRFTERFSGEPRPA